MERKHRALLLALPTVLTLLFFFVAPMVYILAVSYTHLTLPTTVLV